MSLFAPVTIKLPASLPSSAAFGNNVDNGNKEIQLLMRMISTKSIVYAKKIPNVYVRRKTFQIRISTQ